MGLIDNILSRIGNLFALPDAPVEIPIEATIVNALQTRSRDAQLGLVRAANSVLTGPRHGFTYTRRGVTWQASAPGEPPAERSGSLRYGWITPDPVVTRSSSGAKVTITIQSRQPYVRFFDPAMPGFVGSAHMRGPRPFIQAVFQQAQPSVRRSLIDVPFLSIESLNRL